MIFHLNAAIVFYWISQITSFRGSLRFGACGSVSGYTVLSTVYTPTYSILFTRNSYSLSNPLKTKDFLSKIFLKTNARRKLREDFTPLCLLAIHSTFVFYLHSSPLVNGWSHFTIHFSSRMQWRCWPIFIWRPTTGEMPPTLLTWYSKKTKTPTRQENISKGVVLRDLLLQID